MKRCKQGVGSVRGGALLREKPTCDSHERADSAGAVIPGLGNDSGNKSEEHRFM